MLSLLPVTPLSNSSNGFIVESNLITSFITARAACWPKFQHLNPYQLITGSPPIWIAWKPPDGTTAR